jgi:transposase-like protein
MTPELRAFTPPFCPRPECPYHCQPDGWQWRKDGTHERQAAPHVVPRFLCLHCRRSFSSQTFQTSYWLKRPDILPQLVLPTVGCSGYRQLARTLGVAPSTVANQVRRLGRHCLLFQLRHGLTGKPQEPVVLDGVRSFEYSQYWPFDLNIVVGSNTHYFYGFNCAELRRSGSMTSRQKKRREALEKRLGRPDPKATRKTVESLLRRVTGGPCELRLSTDKHSEYPKALQSMKGWTIEHDQTSSKEARTPNNPLWPVNLADLLMRHGGSNHKRETIAFSKRAQSALARTSIFQVWRNFMKGVSEREGKRSPSPAMTLGLRTERLQVDELLAKRIFVSHLQPPKELRELYFEQVPTRQIPEARHHELSYAA